jgi:type IV pilus assembly protein PilP
MKIRANISHLILTLSVCLVASSPLPIQAAPEIKNGADANPSSKKPALELPATDNEPAAVFTYQLEGRHDPFSPFITEKAASNINMDEVVDNEEALTGMQLFEPGQLKLVAIAFEKNAELAMVEDAAGQGYAIRPGMKIGKKGTITTIDPNQVIIEETSVTRAGKQLTNNIVMKLKKEGEE